MKKRKLQFDFWTVVTIGIIAVFALFLIYPLISLFIDGFLKEGTGEFLSLIHISRHSEHVIELGGIADAPTTGFTTWRMDGVTQLGDFSDYTTVYRTLDNAVQLSDDGSVYVEPEVPEPGEPRPTQEERIKALENQNETLLQCILEMSEIVYA